jgi:hypothetical protein
MDEYRNDHDRCGTCGAELNEQQLADSLAMLHDLVARLEARLGKQPAECDLVQLFHPGCVVCVEGLERLLTPGGLELPVRKECPSQRNSRH